MTSRDLFLCGPSSMAAFEVLASRPGWCRVRCFGEPWPALVVTLKPSGVLFGALRRVAAS